MTSSGGQLVSAPRVREPLTTEPTLADQLQEAPRSGLAAYRRLTRVLVILDAACAVAAARWFNFAAGHPVPSARSLLVESVVAAILWVAVFRVAGLYRVRHFSAGQEFKRIIAATVVGVFLAVAVTSWAYPPFTFGALASTVLLAWALESIARGVVRALIGRSKRQGGLRLNTLVVGTNGDANRLAHELAQPGRGFYPIGYVRTRSEKYEADGLPILGRINALLSLIRRYDIECVYVEPTALSTTELSDVYRVCRLATVDLKMSARVPEVLPSHLSFERMEGLMALSIEPKPLTGGRATIKRIFDVGLASLALIVALPLMTIMGMAIRLTSRGPMLYRQKRVTKDDRVFTMFKFRTMVEDPERVLDGSTIDLTKPFFKLKDDPRLTRVGRFLRATSLDELPQLWNVIIGDMSLVGPRPLPVEQVEAHAEFLRPRHEVLGGITGWWQISGRSELDSEEALRLDRFYIENWSLGLDIYILLRTVGAVLAGRGAF
jgi:exopolysaccharide biosynthesis polyprenyl glycosylphosphotransferase